MKKLKMTKYMIEDFEKKMEKVENGELDREAILEELKEISKAYSIPFGLRVSTSKLKTVVKDASVENNVSSIETQEENTSEESIAENKETEQVLDEEHAIEANAQDVNKIKEFLRKRKKALIAGVTVAALAIAGGSIAKNLSNETEKDTKVEDISDDIDNTLKEEKELSENLAFDPLDKELEVEMMGKFLSDSLPKGIELTETGLENQIDKWINFKNLANFDEFGISDLANKYQNDKVTYIDVYNDYTACATLLTIDSITASKENNELIDLSFIFAEKDALELVSKFEDMNGQLVDARRAKDEAKMMEIAKEYNTLIKDELMADDVDAYNPIAYDLSIRYALKAKEILLDYKNVQNVLMDKSLENVLAVNGKCLDDGEVVAKMLDGEIPGFTNKYSTNVIKMLGDVKVKLSEMYKNLDKDFSNELSQQKEDEMIAKYLLDNNLLSTYVANISYEEYYYGVENLENMGSTMPKNAVKKGSKSYVSSESMAKVGINVEEERAKGKTDTQIIAEYEKKVVEQTNKELEQKTTVTDMDGNVQQGTNKEDYAKYYELGSSMGVQAAVGKTTKISTVSIPSSVPSQYHEVFTKAYMESYNAVVEQNINALQNSNTEYQPTTEQEVSKEETTDISAPIKDEDVKVPYVETETTTEFVPLNSSRLEEIQKEIENLQIIKATAQYVNSYYESIDLVEENTYVYTK